MKSKSLKLGSLFLVIALSLILVVTTVSAKVDFNIEITDLKNNVVTVSGTTDAADANKINILVLNPEYTIEDALTKPEAVQYQWTENVENGNFELSFPLNLAKDFEKGTFNIYVGGNGNGTPVPKALTFTSFDKRLEYAKGVYKRVTDADANKTEAANYLRTAAELLTVHDAFYAVSAVAIVSELSEYVKKNPIDFGDGVANEDEKIEKEIAAIGQLVDDINLLSVLQAFREGKSQFIISDSGSIKADIDNRLKLTETLNSNTTLSSALNNITADGIKAISNSLMGVEIEDEEDLAKKYALSVILNGIKYNKQMGIDYVNELLTSTNADFAGLEIPKYLALTDVSVANSLIINNKTSLTLSNLASKIEEAAQSTGSDKPVSGSASSSGGSSYGGGGTTVMQPAKPVASESKEVFSDIASYTWANEAIKNLASKGIIAGIGDGQFNPAGQLTREQAVKIVCLALGFTASDADYATFADEAPNAWYAPYLAIARANGIANGQGDNIFGVGTAISRQDFAVMLYRALKAEEANEELAFADSDAISPYAKNAVSYFASRKIISGYTDGTFKPAAPISRAEAAKLVYELIK